MLRVNLNKFSFIDENRCLCAAISAQAKCSGSFFMWWANSGCSEISFAINPSLILVPLITKLFTLVIDNKHAIISDAFGIEKRRPSGTPSRSDGIVKILFNNEFVAILDIVRACNMPRGYLVL